MRGEREYYESVQHYLEGLKFRGARIVFCERMDENRGVWTLEPHSHAYIELIYITDGSLKIDAPGRQVSRAMSSLIVYPRGVVHHEHVMLKEHREIICIGVEAFATAEMHTSFEISDSDGRLRWLMESILCEFESTREDKECMMDISLEMLRLLIVRGFEDQRVRRSDSIDRCIGYIHSHLQEDLSVETLSKVTFLSASHLTRMLRRRTGCSPNEYVRACRVDLAKKLLTVGIEPIETVAISSGFRDAKYFSRVFKQITGMTPMRYRMAYTWNKQIDTEEINDYE